MDKPSGAHDHRHAHYPLTDFLEAGSAKRLSALLERLVARQDVRRTKLEDLLDRVGTRGGSTDTADEKPTRPTRPTRPGRGKGEAPSIHELLHKLFDGVTLCRLHGSVLGGRRTFYAYDIGLNSDKRVGFVVPNPFDTLIVFGRSRSESPRPTTGVGLPPLDRFRVRSHTSPLGEEREVRERREAGSVRSGRTGIVTPAFPALPGTRPDGGRDRPKRPRPEVPRPTVEPAPVCDLNLRFVVDEHNALQTLQLHGPDIRIYFSKGLVRPVRKTSQGRYVPTGERQGVALGDETITLSRGRTPRLSAPLVFDDNLVQIGGQGVIAILKQVTLGGTASKPKLVFDRTELIF